MFMAKLLIPNGLSNWKSMKYYVSSACPSTMGLACKSKMREKNI
jgi:hypothetical protein